MADAGWTTYDEQFVGDTLTDDSKRLNLILDSALQKQCGLVGWGGYVFHVYKEILEKHSIDLSEYPIPQVGLTELGNRVQNKINKPSEVILDVMMVTTGFLSTKTALSASYSKFNFSPSSVVDAFPWVSYPLGIGGIMDKLKEAMYKGWALPYNGKYGRIENMVITSIEAQDNEKTVYGCPLKIHLKEVLGINHRAHKRSTATCSIQKLGL